MIIDAIKKVVCEKTGLSPEEVKVEYSPKGISISYFAKTPADEAERRNRERDKKIPLH